MFRGVDQVFGSHETGLHDILVRTLSERELGFLNANAFTLTDRVWHTSSVEYMVQFYSIPTS